MNRRGVDAMQLAALRLQESFWLAIRGLDKDVGQVDLNRQSGTAALSPQKKLLLESLLAKVSEAISTVGAAQVLIERVAVGKELRWSSAAMAA